MSFPGNGLPLVAAAFPGYRIVGGAAGGLSVDLPFLEARQRRRDPAASASRAPRSPARAL